jgi:hypothetical protein
VEIKTWSSFFHAPVNLPPASVRLPLRASSPNASPSPRSRGTTPSPILPSPSPNHAASELTPPSHPPCHRRPSILLSSPCRIAAARSPSLQSCRLSFPHPARMPPNPARKIETVPLPIKIDRCDPPLVRRREEQRSFISTRGGAVCCVQPALQWEVQGGGQGERHTRCDGLLVHPPCAGANRLLPNPGAVVDYSTQIENAAVSSTHPRLPLSTASTRRRRH